MRKDYPNWSDGMKLSRTHFIQLQAAVEERLRDSRALTVPLDHGILPARTGGIPSLDLKLTLSRGGRVEVFLQSCNALTLAGDRVYLHHTGITDKGEHELVVEMDQKHLADGQIHHLAIRVDSLEMVPFGVPDPKEAPLRQPDMKPRHWLELIPGNEWRNDRYAANHLVLTRLVVRNGELIEDEGYLPPATAMCALPRLKDFYREYTKVLAEYEKNLLKILVRMNSRDVRTELSDAVEFFCNRALGSLEQGVHQFQLYGDRMPPSMLVGHAIQFAHALAHAIELLTGKGKDVLLNYIKEVTSIAPGDYLAMLGRLTNLSYDPTALAAMLDAVLQLTKANRNLFDEWVRLDYIGVKKDKDIFIHEQAPHVQPPSRPKKGWEF